MKKAVLLSAVAILAVCPACVSAEGADFIPPGELVGTWYGTGYIVVSWCKGKNLPVEIAIKPDGSVDGRIGDAVLTGGRMLKNRGKFAKMLGLFSDYSIRGEASGYLVLKEGIMRKEVEIPCSFENGKLAAAVLGKGSKIGDKNTMMFTAHQLLLVKKGGGDERK